MQETEDFRVLLVCQHNVSCLVVERSRCLSNACVCIWTIFALKFAICGRSLFIHFAKKSRAGKKRINRLPFTCICRKTYFYAFSFRKLKIGGKEQSKWVNWSEKWHGPYDTYEVNTEHTLNIYWKAPALSIWKIAIFASLHLHAEHSNARNGPSVDLGVCVDVLTG